MLPRSGGDPLSGVQQCEECYLRKAGEIGSLAVVVVVVLVLLVVVVVVEVVVAEV